MIKFHMSWAEMLVPVLPTSQDIPVPCHLGTSLSGCPLRRAPLPLSSVAVHVTDLSDQGPKGSAMGSIGIWGFFSRSATRLGQALSCLPAQAERVPPAARRPPAALPQPCPGLNYCRV